MNSKFAWREVLGKCTSVRTCVAGLEEVFCEKPFVDYSDLVWF